MQQYWQQWCDRFVQLSAREKGLITICGFVIIILGLLTLLIEPAFEQNRATSQRITSTKLNVQRLEADILLMTAKLQKDPNQELNQELKQLMVESQELSTQLAAIVENLIAPSQMAQLLEQVLADSKGLHLVSLESQTAEPIVSNESNSNLASYYVHPVRLELTGKYFAIVDYLEALEALPVKYYWRSFHYSVEEYPTARLVLEVYTLGTRQEFIGG
ncbi:type 4a pilus biogenesis protein PilO [Vibrio europaeus]|uniref:MSHA biogenesis protein MshJ n=1 Tax=Vibrio europaeus TaxID=300876 RepID=A0A178JBA4_9VIBR|nr:type II secretion system protein GspM [Vibrio europaeus]MDC5703940.1 type 4a pilus biogenesis protein PilO [Vibrio europaeus]MDC5708876.1 type 4a pilus biogenesis protein PilO [Vibrio europaeus]MDC5713354.1 type 4a pilus biogenesis protein PilO [Vibrio europaeus]MDC5719083.1 type 4a pilus biogenesis protein PilO [Vibrio europaeus]MDC5724949.1 type 4a pilus biogenesis protein PilO [Vibrio europaeus]